MSVSPKGFGKDWELQNVFWIQIYFSTRIYEVGIIGVKDPFLPKANKPFLFWLMLFKLTEHFVTHKNPKQLLMSADTTTAKSGIRPIFPHVYFWTDQTRYKTFDHSESHTPFTIQILTFAVLM